MIDLTQQETIPLDFLQEHTQSLETFSTSEPLLINIQDIDISTVQPMNIEQPQPIQTPHYISTNELSAKSCTH